MSFVMPKTWAATYGQSSDWTVCWMIHGLTAGRGKGPVSGSGAHPATYSMAAGSSFPREIDQDVKLTIAFI